MSLIVVGRADPSAEEANRQFLHRGIAKRAFERRFQLADTIKVTGAELTRSACSISSLRPPGARAQETPPHRDRQSERSAGPERGVRRSGLIPLCCLRREGRAGVLPRAGRSHSGPARSGDDVGYQLILDHPRSRPCSSSLRFFSRGIWSWSGTGAGLSAAIAASRSPCPARWRDSAAAQSLLPSNTRVTPAPQSPSTLGATEPRRQGPAAARIGKSHALSIHAEM